MAVQQASLSEQVRGILESRLPGAQVSVGLLHGARKISGHVVWDGFEGEEHLDRQRMLQDLLRVELGPDAQRVSVIFTYTPAEFDAMGRD
jgi:acid stress-induced BolA-like protein IbaG/YrbA